MKKRLLSLLLVLSLVLSLGLKVSAYDDPRFYDDCEATGESGERISDLADRISEQYGINVCVYITEFCGEQDTEDFISDHYMPCFDQEPGMAFVHAIDKKEWNILTFGGAESIFTIEQQDALWEAYNAEEYYSDCAEALLLKAEEILSAAKIRESPEPSEEITDLNENDFLIPEESLFPRLVDRGELLTEEERESLLSKLNEVSEDLEFDIVVVTVPELGDKTATEYADDFFDYNGYGWGEDKDGVLLLLSMEHRNFAVSTHGYGRTVIPDEKLEDFGSAFLPDISEGNYYQGFLNFTDQCSAFYENAGTGEKTEPGIPNKGYVIGIVLVLGFLMALVLTKKRRDQLTTVVPRGGAVNYLREGSLNLTEKSQHLEWEYETYTLKETERDSDSSDYFTSSGSHESDSGETHGGGSGEF